MKESNKKKMRIVTKGIVLTGMFISLTGPIIAPVNTQASEDFPGDKGGDYVILNNDILRAYRNRYDNRYGDVVLLNVRFNQLNIPASYRNQQDLQKKLSEMLTISRARFEREHQQKKSEQEERAAAQKANEQAKKEAEERRVKEQQEKFDNNTFQLVENLFVNGELKSEVTELLINELNQKVEQMNNQVQRNQAKGLLKIAAHLLIKDVKAVVNELFVDTSGYILKNGLSESAISNVQINVNRLNESEQRTELQKLIDHASAQLNERKERITVLESQVKELFVDNQYTVLKDHVRQATIEDLQKKIVDLEDGDKKTELLKVIEKANNLLKDKIAQTTMSPLNTETEVVFGTGEPNGKYKIKNGSGEILAKGSIDSDGKYFTKISPQEEGSKISITTISNDGYDSSASQIVTSEKLSPITISDIESSTRNINGTGEPGAKIILISNYNKKIAEGTIAKDGWFGFRISAQKDKDVITVITIKGGKNSTLTVKVGDNKIVLGEIENLFTDDTHKALKDNVNEAALEGLQKQVDKITNFTRKAAAQQLLNKAKTLLNYSTKKAVNNLFSDDHYTTLKSGVTENDLADAQSVVDKSIDGAEKTLLQKRLDEAKNLYENQQKVPGIIKINDYMFLQDMSINGKFKGGTVRKFGLIINEEAKVIVSLSSEMLKTGTFSYYTGHGQFNADDDVQIALYDDENNELIRKDVIVKFNGPIVNSIRTVNNFIVGKEKIVEGTFENRKAKKIGLSINGKQKARVNLTEEMLKNGTFSYYVGPNTIKKGDRVQVALYDLKNNQVAKHEVSVK